MQGIQGSTVGLYVPRQHVRLTEYLLFLYPTIMVKRHLSQPEISQV